jgi:hypothetical protein
MAPIPDDSIDNRQGTADDVKMQQYQRRRRGSVVFPRARLMLTTVCRLYDAYADANRSPRIAHREHHLPHGHHP